MRWEQMTSKGFEAVKNETQVCILTFGVIEKHGDHLPLGTDFLNVHKLAVAASEMEASVVFPPFYFGQIFEAKTFPGAIAIQSDLLLRLTQNLLDEIGRNGFKKIVLVNGHGGNDAFLKFVAQCQLEQKKSYQVYLYQPYTPERTAFYKDVCETTIHGHACECETSISLYNHSELVHMDQVSNDTTEPKKRLAHIPNLFSGLSWYANYPEHYVGNATVATIEKGKRLFDYDVKQLAHFIKAVKEDCVLHALANDFHKTTQH